MKRLCFIVGLALLAIGASLPPAQVAQFFAAAPGAACATTDTTAAHDEFLEGFETPTTCVNDGNAWTYSEVGTTANIDECAAAPAGGPAGTCAITWHITVPTDGTATYSAWDKGSEIDIDASGMVFTIPFYIVAGPDTSGEAYQIFRALNAANATCFDVNFRNSLGDIQVLAEGNTTPAWTTITTGEWHTMVVTLDAAGAALGSTYSVDGGADISFTRVPTRDLQRIRLGPGSGLVANEDGELYFGTLAIDTP